MPATIVLDHPRRHVGRRLWRRVLALAGGVMLVVGIAATVVAVPANLLALGWLLGEDMEMELGDELTVTVNHILLVWAVSTPLAIGGISRGLRLVRAGRTLVLFLRRFGDDDATGAVTFAVTRTIGSSWRLVTLDDAEIRPVGVPTSTRLLFRGVTLATTFATGAVNVLLRVFPAAQLALWGIIGMDLVRARIWERAEEIDAWAAVLNPYLGILFTTLDGRLPLDAVALSLPGAFALLAVAIASIVLALGAAFAAAPIAWIVSGLFLFAFSFSADTVHEAERAKTREIKTEADISSAAHTVADRSRKVFGPRLVVLRVASPVWRQTVRRFAATSSVALIDISEPTEHLAWEIEELASTTPTRCLFIGHQGELGWLTGAVTPEERSPWQQRVAALLDQEEVLAYTTDRKGMRRFARALRNRLLSAFDGDDERPLRQVA